MTNVLSTFGQILVLREELPGVSYMVLKVWAEWMDSPEPILQSTRCQGAVHAAPLETKGLTHLVCMAVLDKKMEETVNTWHLLISGSFQETIGTFSIILLPSLLAVPVGGFVVERALQVRCQALHALL